MSLKTLYFDSFCGYNVSAVTEDGKICEFNFEKRQEGCAVGNVYKGRVEKILPGMHAAFINCGLKKNCYLSADDYYPEREALSDIPRRELPELHEGDEIMVQVVKLPVGAKGARVSARLAIVGKSLIFMPDTPFIGVSRKISDPELRKNLVYSAERLKEPEEGLIVRTAAPYSKRNQIEEEYSYLKNLWRGINNTFPEAKVGQLLYTDFALPVRVLRDTLSGDIDSIVVGSQILLKVIEKIVNLYPPRTRRPVILHDTGRDMMDELGISKQFLEIISPRAELENGGYIIIEPTEALTVIDVNTGSFTGDDNLEQTVYYTNILAAREIARQVRLRNIGGIVVVDFIDMQLEEHKKALKEELEKALSADSAKCVVSPVSRLGLIEFSRKRTGISPLPLMVRPCRHCGGKGYTRTDEFLIIGLRANLLNLFSQGVESVRIDLNNELCAKLVEWKEMRRDLHAHTKGQIYAVPHRTYHEEKIVIKPFPFNIPYDAVEI